MCTNMYHILHWVLACGLKIEQCYNSIIESKYLTNLLPVLNVGTLQSWLYAGIMACDRKSVIVNLFIRSTATVNQLTRSALTSSRFLWSFSSSRDSWFLSSSACIRSLRWSWSRSLDSVRSLSTVADRRTLCCSFILSRLRLCTNYETMSSQPWFLVRVLLSIERKQSSNQSFPPSVDLCVCLSVQCIVAKRLTGIVNRMVPRIRQVVGFGRG